MASCQFSQHGELVLYDRLSTVTAASEHLYFVHSSGVERHYLRVFSVASLAHNA